MLAFIITQLSNVLKTQTLLSSRSLCLDSGGWSQHLAQSPALCETMPYSLSCVEHIKYGRMVPLRTPASLNPRHWYIGRGLLGTSAWWFIIQFSFLHIAGTYPLAMLPRRGKGKAGSVS